MDHMTEPHASFPNRPARVMRLVVLCFLVSAVVGTQVHSAGHCAIQGQCGKQSLFGKSLPCPYNEAAYSPNDDIRAKLVNICGEKWQEGPICCQDDQLDALQSNLQQAERIISSCPACKSNFFDLFCTFTCSPNQSLFLNVTETAQATNKKEVVTELSFYVGNGHANGFYESCKDVKFGALNSRAMDFIGGGAQNASMFLKFLGDKKPLLGSPFQMNFLASAPGMTPYNDPVKQCNDSDTRYRCTCTDCEGSCLEVPESLATEDCTVGVLPCFTFAIILIYSVGLATTLFAYTAYTTYARHHQQQTERMRLLQDELDDDDEGGIVDAAGMLDRPTKPHRLNVRLHDVFYKIGLICASFPAATILVSLVAAGLLSIGWVRFAVETNPVRLWVSPSSTAAVEKLFFDQNFGPFYRAEQTFLVNETGNVLSFDTLEWWFGVEKHVRELRTNNVSLDDVCFKPTGECIVQSISGYFDTEEIDRESWQDRVRLCTAQPITCLPQFQQPLRPQMILGGYEEDVMRSHALISTWVVNNGLESSDVALRALLWEEAVKIYMKSVQQEAILRGLSLSFSTEASLEQEINESSNTDAKIILISYIVMFFYASLALGGSVYRGKQALIDSKFTLGSFGILIVLLSVSASVGLFSLFGVKVTLIIAEVIPFLVLAVGVDNIFLITHEFERVNTLHSDEEIEVRVARALGRIGPSILLSGTSEIVTFAIGAAVSMPAVRNFAIYAAGAIVFDALLQMTMFVAALSLDQRRKEQKRVDCIPCLVIAAETNVEKEPSLTTFVRKQYAPFLLRKQIKAAVIFVFLAILACALALLPYMQLGLDQRIALPSDSYLIDYFDDLDKFFGAGPPVYFVTKEVNVSQRMEQQALCSRFTTCNDLSLTNILERERKRDASYIADPTASWIDDFMLWLNPSLNQCCRVRLDNPSRFCVSSDTDCQPCFEDADPPWNITMEAIPQGPSFVRYLQQWISSPTTEECPVAGKAAYANSLVMSNTSVLASHFRTSHPPLHSQSDYIEAYTSARRIAEEISDETGLEVFPYSVFYIFFHQYLSIVRLAAFLLCGALFAVFLVSALLLGSIRTAAVMIGTVGMIVTDVMGVMVIWNVSLNAVSLVNLVICVGIGVEFCSHVGRAFVHPAHIPETRLRGPEKRVWAALVNVGPTVFTGITVTKFIGVSVLAFTRSTIFEIYYFRMWLALVILAAAHALIFLPVALSLLGGEGYREEEEEVS